jgi:hypothetical protein
LAGTPKPDRRFEIMHQTRTLTTLKRFGRRLRRFSDEEDQDKIVVGGAHDEEVIIAQEKSSWR